MCARLVAEWRPRVAEGVDPFSPSVFDEFAVGWHSTMISDARGHRTEVTVRPVGVHPVETEPIGVFQRLPLAVLGNQVARERGPPSGGTLHPIAVLAEVYAEGGAAYGEGGPPEVLQDEGQASQAGVGTSQRAVDSRGYALEVRAVAVGARADDGSTSNLQEHATDIEIGLFRKSNQAVGTRQQAVDSRGFPVEVRAADGENAVRDMHGTLLDKGLEGQGLQVMGIDIGRVRLAGDEGRSLQDAPLHLRLNRADTRDDGNWLLGRRAVYCRDAPAVALSLLDAAPYPRTDTAAVRAALTTCCGSTKWVEHMLRSMPFTEAANVFDAADLGWWVSGGQPESARAPACVGPRAGPMGRGGPYGCRGKGRARCKALAPPRLWLHPGADRRRAGQKQGLEGGLLAPPEGRR